MKSKRIFLFLLIIIIILLIPLVAMQFTDEVNWTALDFAAAAALLLTFAILIEVVLRKVKSLTYRLLLCGILLLILFIVWLELAVGLF